MPEFERTSLFVQLFFLLYYFRKGLMANNFKYQVIPPRPIDLMSVNAEREWRSFRNGYEFYEFASGLKENDDAVRVENLLSTIGEETLSIIHSLKLSKKKRSSVNGILNALECYFIQGAEVNNLKID